jgi:ribonucleoside-diphosphate reductase alpha chain
MASAFFNTQAVDAWDNWFRWREHGQLRDRTIESTWERVASGLTARASGTARAQYRRRLLDAFASWQLLPDPRVIATAGTACASWKPTDLVAELNAASFVRAAGQPHAAFDGAAIEDAGALAVYALDDAASMARVSACECAADPQLQVGLVGLSDALVLLGVDYDSAPARAHAREFVQRLASGCLAGAIARARDRGARMHCDEQWTRRAHTRQLPLELVDAATRYGLRYARVTAITSQPQLAAFANNVSDATDPMCEETCAGVASVHRPLRRLVAKGVAQESTPVASIAAQLEMRAAMQPWIDQPIAYPLLSLQRPDAAGEQSWSELAHKLELSLPLTWRTPHSAGAAHLSVNAL